VKKNVALTLVFGLGFGLGANSAAFSQPIVNDGQAVSDNGTEVVCRRLAPPTGSRLGPRNVCKTRADWRALQEESRREVQRQQDASHWSGGG